MKSTNLIAIVLVVVICSSWLGIVFYPSDKDFLRSNPSWNGLKDFSHETHADMVTSLSKVESGTERVLLTIPYLQYDNNDLQQITAFVQGGGTLLVMDDYGYGNQILEALGLGMRFVGKPMLDPYLCYRNEKLPIITNLAPNILQVGVKSLILNHATALTISGPAQILASSSNSSYIDQNENLAWDEGEPQGPFVIAAKADLGQGTVIAVADPSILINSMEDRADNEAFVDELIAVAGENPKIYVDTAHLPKNTLDHAKDFWGTAKEKMSNPYGLVLLVGGILALTVIPFWQKGAKVGRK
jgi:hypothetical protein